MIKEEMLERLKNEIIFSNVCNELKKQSSNLVFGSGNSDSDIVFIGEAPGKMEDLSGLPFVGPAGKLLDQLLKSIELSREDVYITNIVKYRPPNNRDPLEEEKQAFLPYLKKQLAIIKPKVIVTLGRHSLNSFYPKLKISNIHGNSIKMKLTSKSFKDNIYQAILIPLYHPAAALYNPNLKSVLMKDFKNIAQFIT